MKISVNSDRTNCHVAWHVITELKKRGLYGENNEIVLNIDSIHRIGFRKGTKLTLYWEVDDFMILGGNTDWYAQSDLLYVVHPEYKYYYPEKAQILRMACNPDIHKEIPIKKDFDYVFVGSIEPLQVYKDRVILLDKLMRTGASMMITYGKQEEYAKLMSRGKIILNILPKTAKGDVGINARVYESMAAGCTMVNSHPFLERIFKKNIHYLALERFNNITDEEIERVKLAGREEVLSKHTWVHRVDKILEDIKKL
jgi:hypothetical protein